MTSQSQQQTLNVDDDEIDLRELFSAIWAGKWLIISITLFLSIATVFYTLNLPNIYKSEVTLAPAGDAGGLKVPGQLGGLAALAGVDLGGKGVDKSGLALEILKSREFLGRFIEENDLFVPIMAAEGWDRASNQLLINAKIYDASGKKWVRNVEEPFKPKPSVLETIEEFEKSITVNQDKTSGMVKISVQHYSPLLAKHIVDKLVLAINEDVRARDLQESEKSIEYLNKKIQQTSLADVRTMLFSLIEEQTKTLMLANVRHEYVFKTIDPAVVSEKKAKPARALMCVLAFIAGIFLGSVVVLIRHFNFK